MIVRILAHLVCFTTLGILVTILLFFPSFAGLPNDLAIYWQQYPWMWGETMCKGRSLVSEM